MKRNVKLFEDFDDQPERTVDIKSDGPMAPAPVIEDEQPATTGDIVFDPARANEYSSMDDKDRLVVNASFGDGSFLGSFHPNEGREVLWLMPNEVEDVTYIGDGDARWSVTFGKGMSFEEAWNTLRDHDGTIMLTLKRLGSNRTWSFDGFAPISGTGSQMKNK